MPSEGQRLLTVDELAEWLGTSKQGVCLEPLLEALLRIV